MSYPLIASYRADTGYSAGSHWNDQSGNGNHIVSAGAGTWPVAATVNGLACLRPNGGNDRLMLPAGVPWDRQNMTVMAVVRTLPTSLGGVIYAASGLSIGLLINGGTTKPTVYAGGYNDIAEPYGHNRTIIGFRASAANLKFRYGPNQETLSALPSGSGSGGVLFAFDDVGNAAFPGDVYRIDIYDGVWSD